MYVNANNLLTWSSVFPGVDPELSGTVPGVTPAVSPTKNLTH